MRWWVSIQWFPPEWVLAQLALVLRLVGTIAAEHRVLKRLAELAPAFPGEAVECFHALISGHAADPRLAGAQEEVRRIVTSGVAGNERTRNLAIETVHRLSAYGWPEYLSLLA